MVPIFRNVATSHMLASPMITWSRRYFSGSACGSSRVLMIGRLSVVSRPTSVSKKSARCVSWYVVGPGSSQCLDADLAGAAEHLAAHEERRQVTDDVAERRRAIDQVVLVGPVGVALAVAVVLVDRQPWSGRKLARDLRERSLQDPLARLVVHHQVAGRDALGRGVLGMGVVHVVAGAVRQDDVRETQILVAALARRHRLEPAGVAERRLLLVVPADAAERAGVRRDQDR